MKRTRHTPEQIIAKLRQADGDLANGLSVEQICRKIGVAVQEVLRILRELIESQSRTQVILTTHSPYVVDLFKPEEVTLCRKGPDGAVTTHRLSESRAVREQMDVFTLGEIWTAEGDEKLAEPLRSSEAAPR